jgi:hypothetical protein
MASAALASHGVESVVQHDHGQYATMGSWVHVQVARRDRDLATTVLESGPTRETDSVGGPAESPEAPASDRTDDMRELRLQRRLTLGRWILYAGAVGALPFLFLFFMPLFVVPLGLALWSRADPRRAFAVAFGIQTIVVFVAVAKSGPTGMVTLFPLLAFYYAFMAAAPNPPEALVAGPVSPTIDIGEAWQVPIVVPSEGPIRLARPLALAAALVVALWGGWLVFRALGILDAP